MVYLAIEKLCALSVSARAVEGGSTSEESRKCLPAW